MPGWIRAKSPGPLQRAGHWATWQGVQTSRGELAIPPLFDTAEAASGIWHPLLGSQVKTDVGEPRKTQQRATKVVKLQQETCRKRLRVLGLLTLAERRLTGDLIAACSYLRGSCKDHEAILFLAVPDAIIRDNDLKLWLGSFRLETCRPLDTSNTWLDECMADML